MCVVMTAKGYPLNPKTGDIIVRNDVLDKKSIGVKLETDILRIFHSGTSFKDNIVVTAGGRVLAVTARAKDLSLARQKVYDAVKRISFDGAFYRTDIARI
ncbi:MAG: phosphoribosylglycinamide synthetase C domain-containing protein [Planctomycetota bacterium]